MKLIRGRYTFCLLWFYNIKFKIIPTFKKRTMVSLITKEKYKSFVLNIFFYKYCLWIELKIKMNQQ